MGELLQLVDPVVSSETLDAITQLLEEVRAGRVVGVAWIARHRGNLFTADAVGTAKDDPVHTRGMLKVLDDELGQMIRR